MQAEILALVDEEIEKGTLSARAADGVAKLRTEHAAQEKRIEDLLEEINRMSTRALERDKTQTRMKEELDAFRRDAAAFAASEEALGKREHECRTAELELRLVRQHIMDMKGLVGMVFRNPVLKRTAMVPVVQPPPTFHPNDQGYSSGPQYATVMQHQQTEEEVQE